MQQRRSASSKVRRTTADPATGSVPLAGKAARGRRTLPADYTQFLNPKGLQGRRS